MTTRDNGKLADAPPFPNIKFWSATTLSQLLKEGAFDVEGLIYAGRAYSFSKSVVIYAMAAS